MERAGDAFLADAGFAQDENAGDRWSETFDGLPERLDGGGLADEQVFRSERGAAIQLQP